MIAIEGGWLDRVRATQLYRYELPEATFVEDNDEQKGPGYYVSYEPVVPLSVQPVGDLLASLLVAGVELRLTPSLWPLSHALLPSTLHFSMIRMRNAQSE